jgi:hypothetical protein
MIRIKKTTFHFLAFCLFYSAVEAQVLTVNCFEQNERISGPVNNLISNGSFEITNCPAWDDLTPYSFCPASTYYDCILQDWTTNCGSSSYPLIFDASRVVIADGLLAAYLGNSTCNACSASAGDTSCLSQVFCEVTGIPAGYPFNPGTGYNGGEGVSIEQIVTGLIADSVYYLEFWAGGENGYFNKGLFAVNVGFGNIFLRDKRTQPSSTGTRFLVRFKATSSAHTIKFTNWGHICSTCTELVVDDVRLYTNAEFTGIAVVEGEIASVFPNPFAAELNIATPSWTRDGYVTLYSYLGQEILHQKINSVSTILNTEALETGLYFLRIESGSTGSPTGRVVKNYKVVKGN